jgi:hypothetical protein
MGPVVEILSSVPEADVKGIAVYIASKMTRGGVAEPEPARIDNPLPRLAAFPRARSSFLELALAAMGRGRRCWGRAVPRLV